MLDGRIVSGSRDHTLRVWCRGEEEGGNDQVGKGQGLGQEQGQGQGYGPGPGQGICERVLTGHQGSVTCVTPLIDPPTHICSGSNDRTIKVRFIVTYWGVFACVFLLLTPL